MTTRLDKIKAEDEKLQHLGHIHGSAEGEVAHWMVAHRYTIPQGDDVDMDRLLSAIATQAAERAVALSYSLYPATPDGVPE